MADTIRAVDYFYAMVGDKPGEGRRLLEHLSEKGVNLLAFTAFPTGNGKTQLDFFAEDAGLLKDAAADAGLDLVGPKKGFLIQGQDRVGALHQHHLTLANAGINVVASNGVCDGTGRYGFVLWVATGDFAKAAEALGSE
jgi:hypothetical protein